MDAGLPDGEKKLIEAAFRNKTLRVICATSTLATGVNLPADRVVMRGPWPDWKHAGGMKIDKYDEQLALSASLPGRCFCT
jgi:replicative superfamily II helicase